MKVGWFTHLWPSSVQSVQGTHVAALAQAVADSVHLEVVVPTAVWPPGSRLRSSKAENLVCARPPYIGIPRVGDRFESALMDFTCGRALSEMGRRCDLLHVHFAYPDGAAAVRRMRRDPDRPPMVLTVHGSDIHTFPQKRGLLEPIRNTLEAFDVVVAVSSSLAELIRDIAPSVVVRVIPNGVDAAFVNVPERRDSTDVLELLFVGSLVAVKRVDLLISAFALLPANWRLRIVGGGPLHADVKAAARSCGAAVAERVCLEGVREGKEIAKMMVDAEVVALVSAKEGLPCVLLEAAAVGTPWVALSEAGARDVLALLPDTGLVPEDATPSSIADAILAAAAMRHTPRVRTWDEVADAYLQTYRSCLEGEYS